MNGLSDFFDEIFGSEDLEITEVEIDGEVEYKKYILSIYEKVKFCESGSASSAAEEALRSREEADSVYTGTVSIQQETPFEFE